MREQEITLNADAVITFDNRKITATINGFKIIFEESYYEKLESAMRVITKEEIEKLLHKIK